MPEGMRDKEERQNTERGKRKDAQSQNKRLQQDTGTLEENKKAFYQVSPSHCFQSHSDDCVTNTPLHSLPFVNPPPLIPSVSLHFSSTLSPIPLLIGPPVSSAASISLSLPQICFLQHVDWQFLQGYGFFINCLGKM